MAHLWLNYLLRIKTNIHIEPLVYPRVSTILNHDHVCWFPKFLSPSPARPGSECRRCAMCRPSRSIELIQGGLGREREI